MLSTCFVFPLFDTAGTSCRESQETIRQSISRVPNAQIEKHKAANLGCEASAHSSERMVKLTE